MIRASMIEVMQRPYIRTAVLKGMPLRDVILRHAVRNAMINPITVIMLQINYLIAGVVVVETVFAYPGFGRMMLEAALFKDIALVEAGALVAVFVAVATNILGDLAYMVLEPRIRACPMSAPATAEVLSVSPHAMSRRRARDLWRGVARVGESRPATVGVLIILFWLAVAALAPLLAPYPPNASDLAALAHPTPSRAHWLGTDHLGRDLLSRLAWGARPVLVIAPL